MSEQGVRKSVAILWREAQNMLSINSGKDCVAAVWYSDWALEWLSRTKQVVTSVNCPGPYQSDWDIPSNIKLAFQTFARRLAAIPGANVPAQGALNSFSNERPFVLRSSDPPHCWYTFDLFSSRIPDLEGIIATFAEREDIHALLVKPGEGLGACWILERLLTTANTRVDIVGAPVPLTYERAIFLRNMSLCSQIPGSTRVLTGPYREWTRTLDNNVKYDLIYIEGRRSLRETQHLPDILATLLQCWSQLKHSGTLIIDDQLASDDRLGTIIAPSVFGYVTELFLSTIRGKYSIRRSGQHAYISQFSDNSS